MADVKEKFGTATAFTVTNANIASSATVGWVSNIIDNSTNLYLDVLVKFVFTAVNTAPANSKAIFCYAFDSIDGTVMSSAGGAAAPSGEGTHTFPDVTTLPVSVPLLGVIPYPVQNIAIVSPAFSIAACFGGVLPPKWCVGYVNHTGITLTGAAHKYIEVYRTVV